MPTSIIGTVPLNWRSEISLNKNAVGGLSPMKMNPKNYEIFTVKLALLADSDSVIRSVRHLSFFSPRCSARNFWQER